MRCTESLPVKNSEVANRYGIHRSLLVIINPLAISLLIKSQVPPMTKCPTCAGDGLMPGFTDLVCSACVGEGNVLDSECINCRGAGTMKVATEVLCGTCNGIGYLSGFSSESIEDAA